MMRVLRVVSAGFVAVLSVGVVSAMPASAHHLRQASLLPAKFSCTGAEQTYSVPAGVRALKVKAIGAAGGASSDFAGPGTAGSGGQGAVVGAWVRLSPATSTVYVEVGCAGSTDGQDGFNGGGGGSGANGGGGGGASDVRLDPMSTALTTSDTRLVVAGGGGGGGTCDAGGAAGDGSVTGAGNGGNGNLTFDCSGGTAGGNGGFGGTTGGGGGTDTNGCDVGAGSLGQGGSINTGCDPGNAGGGGGGGYYGGGAGGDASGNAGGGGGAGSSFWRSSATHTSMAMNTTSLTPKVVLTPACLVPKLKGKTLAAAKTALANRHCALGTVTKKVSSGPAGIVLSQNPKPGTILTIGSKVAVVVSKT